MSTKKKSTLNNEVFDYLVSKISTEYNPRDLIPTQIEIAEATNTSLITVKRAINELINEGLLESKPGKGTFRTKPTIIDPHIGVPSWTDSITGLGKVPKTS